VAGNGSGHAARGYVLKRLLAPGPVPPGHMAEGDDGAKSLKRHRHRKNFNKKKKRRAACVVCLGTEMGVGVFSGILAKKRYERGEGEREKTF
jgi:hypothetical protein